MTAATLLIAMALDAVLGEPKWLWTRLPHPAVLMGRLIGWADDRFNTGTRGKAKGVMVLIGLIVAAGLLGQALSQLGTVIEILVTAILLAQRSLVDHVQAVAMALRHSLERARQSVAMIVGRDTRDMTRHDVARGAIESAAENLSDGVIAPAFWFLLFGLPGLLIYKVTNTADSMIGYRTEKHADFGWAAARFDDLINLAPARLTALIIAGVYGLWPSRSAIIREARRHRSPNAGWPEAAMARALNVSLSGPRSYDGQMQDFPYVFPEGRKTPDAPDVEAACRALWVTWACFAAIVFVLWMLGF